MGDSSGVKALATKYDGLNLINSGRKELTPYSCSLMCVCTHRQTSKERKKEERKSRREGSPRMGNTDLKDDI